MADEPTLEPGVLAVEAYREELAYQRRKSWAILGAVMCAVVGAGIMFAVLFFGTDLFRAKPTTAALLNPPIKKQIPNVSTYVPDQVSDVKPQTSAMYSPDTAGPKPPESNTAQNPKPPTQSHRSSMPPFNPFAGGGVPEGWGGSGPIKGHVDVNPEGGPDNPPNPASNPAVKEGFSQAAPSTLITGRSQGGDPEDEAKEIASALQSLGGSVRLANHFSPAGGVIGVQIVATFPASALSDARSKLTAKGVQIDVSESSPAQRSSRVAGILSARISDLKKERAALEEKYLSDAPEIVQIDEEIQSLTQAIGTARGAGKSSVALIAVGSL